MAMFGSWTDPKMPTHCIAQAKLGIRGIDKMAAFDQRQAVDDFMQMPEANRPRT